MDKNAKMMLLKSNSTKMHMPYEREWGEGGGMQLENRFRDKSGREHYDNGHFAPESSKYNINRIENHITPHYNDDGEIMQPIGFNGAQNGGARAGYYQPIQNIYPRMSTADGGSQASSATMPLGGAVLHEWEKIVDNGSNERLEWSVKETDKLMRDRGADYDPVEFNAAMNALKRIAESKQQSAEFFADMASAWLYIVHDCLQFGGSSRLKATGDSEFMRAADGKDAEKAMQIVDELMESLKYVNNRVYESVLGKLREI